MNVNTISILSRTVWLDGFQDVLLRGHSSHSDDNPYDRDEHSKERHAYEQYQQGALAAEMFEKCTASKL